MRLGLLAALYTPDLQNFQNGDYTLYAIGAEHIAEYGDFSNSLFLVRPPAFPALILLLKQNALLVLLVNVLLGALSAPVTVALARRCGLSERFALVAGMLVAFDPASAVYSAFLGPEALANLGSVMALWLFVAAVQSGGRRGLLLAVLAALALVVSAYARPATYLLWIVLVVWGLVWYRNRKVVAAVFALVSIGGTGLWMLHNQATFGNATMSTIGGYNLLYYRAASVESRGSGLSIDETYAELSRRVEALLGNDTSGVDSETRQGHYAATSELQAAMQSVALDVFLRYPHIYLATLPIGLYRILIVTQFPLSGVEPAFAVVNALLVVGAFIGLIALLRQRQFRLLSLILLVGGYYLAGTLMVQTSGIDTRARTPVAPVIAIAVGYWLQQRATQPRASSDDSSLATS